MNDGYLADSTNKKTKTRTKTLCSMIKLFEEDKTCLIIPSHWLALGECILGIRSKSATLTKTLHEVVLFVQKF